MAFDSLLYLFAFLLPVYAVWLILPPARKWYALLAGSIVFYLISSPFGAVAVAVSAASVYACARALSGLDGAVSQAKGAMPREDAKKLKLSVKTQKKYIVFVCVLIQVGLLLLLKYFNFFASGVNAAADALGLITKLPELKLAVPLGISFYTLQAISYVVDVYRKAVTAERNFAKLLLYLIFFPTVVEGPICRYNESGAKLCAESRFDFYSFRDGVLLMCWGLFKKVVIANRCNMLVNTVFGDRGAYSGLIVLTAILAYTLQLYADFSGCIDIVRGTARLFGVGLPENFDAPFFSRSTAEFWRRWHITLGTWFRDYVFYPLSLSKPFASLRKKTAGKGYYADLLPTATAMFAVWTLTGLWHGASLKYLVYGLYYFAVMLLGLLVEKPAGKLVKDRDAALWRFVGVVRTFVIVNIGMLIFRADTLTAAWQMFASLFTPYAAADISEALVSLRLDSWDLIIVAVGACVMAVYSTLKVSGRKLPENGTLPGGIARAALIFVLIIAVTLLGAYGDNYDAASFIYAGF
ncbi:MAG: MBOAT family protein [Clostridia bacterium]|nr:MBOAT family protein [Clostridia bacterium]